MRARVTRSPRILVRQSSLAMQRAARGFFQRGREMEFARAANLMEEINRFLKDLERTKS